MKLVNELETRVLHPYNTELSTDCNAMIVYDLSCDNDHEFESWFKNSAAYDSLRKGRKIACPVCGSPKIHKAPMAPNISKSGIKEMAPAPVPDEAKVKVPDVTETDDMAAAMTKAVEAIKELQTTIEKNFDNVGVKFPEEARKIHYGEAEQRGIYGEATAEEAQELIDEGVDIAAVPWQKTKPS
ncbi:MAG: DUF1178 family protein [Rhodospirillaceae bacterium]